MPFAGAFPIKPKDFAGLWWWDGNFAASYWFSKRYAGEDLAR
jgi:hypothetical protein